MSTGTFDVLRWHLKLFLSSSSSGSNFDNSVFRKMKLTIAVLICCALIGSIQSQGTGGNRPNLIQAFFAPIGQLFSIFRRPTRPSSVSAAAAASSGSIDVNSIFSDPQLVQDSLNSISQASQGSPQQVEPVIETKFVTETMTVFSTIPSLERVTSVETMVEMTTQTVYETIKQTETVKSTSVMTEHITMTHSTCSSSAMVSSKVAPLSSAAVSKVAEKVSPSVVSTWVNWF